jgi:hypothetical protein
MTLLTRTHSNTRVCRILALLVTSRPISCCGAASPCTTGWTARMKAFAGSVAESQHAAPSGLQRTCTVLQSTALLLQHSLQPPRLWLMGDARYPKQKKNGPFACACVGNKAANRWWIHIKGKYANVCLSGNSTSWPTTPKKDPGCQRPCRRVFRAPAAPRCAELVLTTLPLNQQDSRELRTSDHYRRRKDHALVRDAACDKPSTSCQQDMQSHSQAHPARLPTAQLLSLRRQPELLKQASKHLVIMRDQTH